MKCQDLWWKTGGQEDGMSAGGVECILCGICQQVLGTLAIPPIMYITTTATATTSNTKKKLSCSMR